ncbi:MAG: SsgA family sporulation/cell division regulator [Kutzneria sp.]|nr:SsgA family sporulation/cell division regulator [Kutzneria sp.]
MGMDRKVISSKVEFGFLAAHDFLVPLEVELRYDTTDPFAVVASFRPGREDCVEWAFSRDLLADGLIGAVGDGDIRIRPSMRDVEMVVVELRSPAGEAVFEAPAEKLADFLDTTYDVLMPGEEHLWVDIDAELSRLTSLS